MQLRLTASELVLQLTSGPTGLWLNANSNWSYDICQSKEMKLRLSRMISSSTWEVKHIDCDCYWDDRRPKETCSSGEGSEMYFDPRSMTILERQIPFSSVVCSFNVIGTTQDIGDGCWKVKVWRGNTYPSVLLLRQTTRKTRFSCQWYLQMLSILCSPRTDHYKPWYMNPLEILTKTDTERKLVSYHSHNCCETLRSPKWTRKMSYDGEGFVVEDMTMIKLPSLVEIITLSLTSPWREGSGRTR